MSFASLREPGPSRTRLFALLAVLAFAAVAINAFAGRGTQESDSEDSNPAALPEGGGRSGAAERTGAFGSLNPAAALVDSIDPGLLDAPVRGSAVPRSVTDLAKRLPLSRQVAQLFVVGFRGTVSRAPFFSQLRRRDWGGVLFDADNYFDPQQLAALTAQVRRVARRSRQVPPFVAAAQDGSENAPFKDLPPRSQSEQAIDGGDGVQKEARLAGRQLGLLGISLVLAPIADVGAGAGPLRDRTFSDSPSVVSTLTRAALAGYNAAGITAAPGHFPGQGGAPQDPLAGPAPVGLSRDQLEKRDLVPFRDALREAPAVVVSNAIYAAFDGVTPATLLPEVVGDLLRDELGFSGVAIADDLAGAAAVTGGSVGDAAVAALQAGCDLLLLGGDDQAIEEAYRGVLAAVRSGELPEERVNEALLRVLRLKERAGLIAGRGR